MSSPHLMREGLCDLAENVRGNQGNLFAVLARAPHDRRARRRVRYAVQQLRQVLRSVNSRNCTLTE
jgi:hypothetical protein